jgi:PAS domain S-box-containing protein
MSDRQKKYNIPLHLLLVFVLLVIGIVTSGYLLYATQKAELKKRDNNDLSAIAALKVREIDSWRKERLEDAHVIQQNLPAIHRIRQLLENPSSDEIRQELLPWIKSLRESYQCGSVVLFDTNKEVRLYWGDETKLVGSNAAALVEEAMQTKQIIFSDIYWGQVKHVIRLDISVPLFIREGHEDVPVGVLLLRIDPHRNLYPMIQFWPTSSPTAETLVVRREGDEVVFLNELRHKKDTPLSFRMPISEKQSPAAMAARGEEGIVEGMDYRSVPVLAAIKAVPDTPWYVIAKIDSDEVYATVHELFWMMFIVVCALIISAGTATALVWRHQRARFYRKQYEAELEHEALTKHYEFLTKYANDIILMVDGGWKIVEANERAVQAYGHSYDELLQMNIREVYDPEVIPFLPGWIDQVDKGNGLVYETVHSRKDGTIFPVEISARAITVEGKKFYQAIIRDITARKRSVEALQISEARYRRLFESARDGILIIDADTGQIIDANAFMQDLLGYSCEEFVGKRLWDIGPFKDIAASKSSFDELQRKGYIHYENLPVETSDGGRINVEFISYVYMVDGKNVIQCNIRDITDRKRAEEALRESEELYKTLAEKSMAGVYVVQDGNFRFINSNAASYTGYTREELLDQEAVLIVSPEDRERVRQNAKAMLLGEMSSPYEFRIITKQGETRWIMETVTSILHEGRPAILGNSMDITSHKKMEAEIRDLSITDPLTGLYNRRGFLTLAEQQLNISKRTKVGLLLLFADLDGMKWINDNLGHKKGDEALIEVANVFNKVFRDADIVARVGGDEFSVLAVGIDDGRFEKYRRSFAVSDRHKQ